MSGRTNQFTDSLLNIKQLEFISTFRNIIHLNRYLAILYGGVGVGKSFVLKYLNDFFDSEIVFCGTTGISALHLPFVAETVHSF